MKTPYSRYRARSWTVVAATAALLASIVCGFGSPVAAQSTSTDSITPVAPSSVALGSSAFAYEMYLPLVSKYTVNSSGIFGVQLYSPPTSASAALPLVPRAHVSWIRQPIGWSSIEPSNTTPNHYQFDWLDTQIGAFRASGLNLILTIDGNPSWAATFTNGPIDKVDIREFVEFMAAMVERYDGDGSQDAPGSPVVNYWELYNEPDNGSIVGAEKGASYWGDFGAAYARMLCEVYPAMKAASSNARIVFGGIAYDWFREDQGPFVREFLDDVLAAGGGRCFDVMNFHYYPPFEATWAPYGQGVVGKVNYLRGKLESYGVRDLPMIASEAGYHSNNAANFPSTPETQAGYVVKLFTQSLASGLRVMIWFTWSDYELIGYQFLNGLLDQGLQPKPAYYAYQTAASQLGPAAFQRILSPEELGSSNVQAYLFQRETPLYVVWSNTTSSVSVSLPGSSARVIDYAGNTTASVADGADGNVDGRVRITVGPSPVYVEVTP
jgi:hypothetical protein